MGNRMKNRDVKCTSLFFKVGSKNDAMVFDLTKIIMVHIFFLYYHRWTQFVNHTGVMAAILQIENKIKLSFNFCNSLTLQRKVHIVIIWPILTQCFWRGIRQCIFAISISASGENMPFRLRHPRIFLYVKFGSVVLGRILYFC